MQDMRYDGQAVEWNGLRYKATSGLSRHQQPELQREPDSGPIPAGLYKVCCTDLGTAKIASRESCALAPGWGIERIPRGIDAGMCERFWANWGNNRVRLEAVDPSKTFSRSGFYLHDSTKGFSHGCIEIQTSFFVALRNFSHTTRRRFLILKVDYVAGRSTNGGTLVSP